MAEPPPELLQPAEALRRLVAGNQGAVDRTDRGADDPIRLDAALGQRLIDAGLIGAERAAALKHQHGLLDRRSSAFRLWRRDRRGAAGALGRFRSVFEMS